MTLFASSVVVWDTFVELVVFKMVVVVNSEILIVVSVIEDDVSGSGVILIIFCYKSHLIFNREQRSKILWEALLLLV